MMTYSAPVMSSKKAKTKAAQATNKTAKPEAAKPLTTKKQPAKAAKAAKTTKPSAPAATKKGRGVRYSKDMKKEAIDFVKSYNEKNGRGGQSAAARKFGVTILTISSWLKGSGTSAKASTSPVAALGKTSPDFSRKVKALLDLGDQIRKLQEQYASLSAAIRSEI